MRMKMGIGEIDTMENLMGISAYAEIADGFDVDRDELRMETHLKTDLGMNGVKQEDWAAPLRNV